LIQGLKALGEPLKRREWLDTAVQEELIQIIVRDTSILIIRGTKSQHEGARLTLKLEVSTKACVVSKYLTKRKGPKLPVAERLQSKNNYL